MMPTQVRNGQKVWPTCPACGCRLDIIDDGLAYFLWHFPHKYNFLEVDAKGCKCVNLYEHWILDKRDINQGIA